jgi:hypothetical protein
MPKRMEAIQGVLLPQPEYHRTPEPATGIVSRYEKAKVCACGCGRLLASPHRGRPARFAGSACRMAAYRRRLAGLDEQLPRQPNHHGRRRLEGSR